MKKITLLLILISTLGFGQLKISQLPSASTLTGAELLPGAQSGVTVKIPISSLPFIPTSSLNTLPYIPTGSVSAFVPLTNGTVTVKKTNQIYCFGNSLTAADIYPTALTSSLTAFDRVNYGIGGNTTAQGIARLRSATIGDAKYAIVELGINDVVQSINSDTIISHLNFICNAFKQAGANVVLLNLPPFKTNVNWSAPKQVLHDAVNAACASATATPYADFRVNIESVLETSPGSNTLNPAYDSGDGLHPNSTGYGVIATAIYTTVGTWTVSTTQPTITIGNNRYLSQNLGPLNRPVFKGLILNDSLLMQDNDIQCGDIKSVGSWYGTSISASSNATLSGAVYSNNSYNLGSLGIKGSMTSSSDVFKLLAGSTASTIAFCTPSRPNGSAKLFDNGRFVVGDISSVPTWSNTNYTFQNFGVAYSPTVTIGGNTTHTTSPLLEFRPTNANNSSINFLNTAGSATRIAITFNESSGKCLFMAGSGGHFFAFGSNGTEYLTLNTSGILLATGGASITGATTLAAVQQNGVVTFSEGINVISGTTTGTKFGTATTQKWGFFNATPIVQPVATTDLGTVLSSLGFRAAGTAYPLTSSGAMVFSSAANVISVRNLKGTGTAVTTTTGSAIGTSGTATVTTNSTNTAGKITITTGSASTGISGTLCTVNFANAFGVAPNVVLTPANSAAALLTGGTQIFVSASATGNFTITSGTTAPALSTAYQFYYMVIE